MNFDNSTWWLWTIFFITIFIALATDIFIFKGREAHKVSIKEAASWTAVWVILALLFNLLVWYFFYTTTSSPIAHQKGLEFLTGYLLEKSLSIDNVFVFLTIFHFFAIPEQYQRRVLLYGVLGAIIMRFILIIFGIYLINKFSWILYIFGGFLLFSGIKMLFFAQHEPDLSKNPILKWMRRHFRITDRFSGERFFIRKQNLYYATPLFLALILIEFSDLIFAVDSIPAVFAITHDPFIVFTSNIFAILGLRALYFLFAHLAKRFTLLKYGVAIILLFIGVKMLAAYWIHVPVWITLLLIGLILGGSILLSLKKITSNTMN